MFNILLIAFFCPWATLSMGVELPERAEPLQNLTLHNTSALPVPSQKADNITDNSKHIEYKPGVPNSNVSVAVAEATSETIKTIVNPVIKTNKTSVDNATLEANKTVVNNPEIDGKVKIETFNDTTTTNKPLTTPSTTKTTEKPSSTTPSTTKTTEKPSPTTQSTTKTTEKPSPTTPGTTVPTEVSTKQSSTEAPERHFEGLSFVGGIVLTVGLTAIGFIAFKFYKASNYYQSLRNVSQSTSSLI